MDENRLGTVTYQWQRDGSVTSGATTANYTLMQDDVGAQITVIASYTDHKRTDESVTSATTATVVIANDTPTGSVTITGTATENEILPASNTLADEDGLGTVIQGFACKRHKIGVARGIHGGRSLWVADQSHGNRSHVGLAVDA